MANEKYTRKQFLIDMMATDLTDEQRECAEKWLVALDKKASAPKVNKTRLANEQLVEAVVSAMTAHADEQINAKWLSEHVNGITSPSKAVAVVRVGIELGKLVRFEEKGKTYYRLAQ